MAERGPPSDRPGRRPPAGDAEITAEIVAELSVAAAPMAAGLRAAAREAPTRRLARHLQWMADQMDQGQSLETVLAASTRGVAGCAGGLVAAAARTGKLGEALVELVDHQRRTRELWRSIRVALAYPTVLLALALAILLGANYLIVGPMIKLFEDFGLELPYMTLVVMWLHETGVNWMLGAAAVLIVGLVAFRVAAGATRWHRVLATVPLFGMLWHWSGVAEFARLMAVLTDHGVPLPESLRLAAEGVHDANVAQVAGWLAEGTDRGRPLDQLLRSTHRLPATLAPIVGWGQRAGELSDAFRLASDMFEGRARQRADWLTGFLPPWIFVLVALIVPMFIVALYAPMVNMIQGLS